MDTGSSQRAGVDEPNKGGGAQSAAKSGCGARKGCADEACIVRCASKRQREPRYPERSTESSSSPHCRGEIKATAARPVAAAPPPAAATATALHATSAMPRMRAWLSCAASKRCTLAEIHPGLRRELDEISRDLTEI